MHGQCDARPTVTFTATRHHCLLTGTKLYCLVTEAHVYEHAQGCYLKVRGRESNPRPLELLVQCPNHYTTRPHYHCMIMMMMMMMEWPRRVRRMSLLSVHLQVTPLMGEQPNSWTTQAPTLHDASIHNHLICYTTISDMKSTASISYIMHRSRYTHNDQCA